MSPKLRWVGRMLCHVLFWMILVTLLIVLWLVPKDDPSGYKRIGIVLCLVGSGVFSGLTLASMSLSVRHLEVRAEEGNQWARRFLPLRRDKHWLACTLMMGNALVNALIAVLSGEVMGPLLATGLSVAFITPYGEIEPGAFFMKHALVACGLCAPAIRVLQVLTCVVTWPLARYQDMRYGADRAALYSEAYVATLLRQLTRAATSEIGHVEGTTACNCLALDDRRVGELGHELHPESVISVGFQEGKPVFPDFSPDDGNEFIRRVRASGKKWVVFVDEDDPEQRDPFVMDADWFLSLPVASRTAAQISRHAHPPESLERDPMAPLSSSLIQLTVQAEHAQDHVVDRDAMFVWADGCRRVITLADVAGLILRGVVKRVENGTNDTT